jgi:hypothetical protein
MSQSGKLAQTIDVAALTQAGDLLRYYSFDFDGRSPQTLLQQWADHFPIEWLRLAIIEALYQGRYKAISVEQILRIWQRRQQARPHFNFEFERLICGTLPRKFHPPQQPEPSPIAQLASQIHSRPPSNVDETSSDRSSHGSREIAPPTSAMQHRLPWQTNVQAAIDYAEATLQASAEQGRRTVLGDHGRRKAESTGSPPQDVLTPQGADDETIADQAVVAEPPAPTVQAATHPIPAPSDYTHNIAADTSSVQGQSVNDQETAEPDGGLPQPLTSPMGQTVQAIHQFAPTTPDPELYAKLKAVSQER